MGGCIRESFDATGEDIHLFDRYLTGCLVAAVTGKIGGGEGGMWQGKTQVPQRSNFLIESEQE